MLRALLLLLAFLSGPPAFPAGDAGLAVDDAWVREAPPGAMTLAGYLVLRNHSDQKQVLTGASSPDFASIMMHRTEQVDGMARMTHQQTVVIPPGAEVRFAPNGYHLMLMNPKHPLRSGDTLRIRLEFDPGGVREIEFPVRTDAPGG
ncbi:MAG: copper chaperone PCu(A)C [Gammaproteobacteria bacterium]|jgi:hypothetical protein|nr:copper chaperone PCu(A)C [Gammaproteobacteria bacterium]